MPRLTLNIPNPNAPKRTAQDTEELLRRNFANQADPARHCFTNRIFYEPDLRALRKSKFSQVFRTQSGEIVKQLIPDTASMTPTELQKMLVELNCMRLDASMQHLNFMTELTLCSNHIIFISNECKYGNLSNIIGNTQLPLSALYWSIFGTFKALAFFHASGFAHLDVKGDQFLVTGQGTILLTDFAEAKTIIDSEGTPCVTDLYRRCLMYGLQADTASLAIVLCKFACRQHPWALDDGNPQVILCDPYNTVPEALKLKIPEIYPEIDRELLELLINMLVIDSNPRPSASDVLRHMESTWSGDQLAHFRAAALVVFEENFMRAKTAAATSAGP